MIFGKIARWKRLQEERLYQTAARELERGERREGLWAKALANNRLDYDGATADYLKLRVQSLADEEKGQNHIFGHTRAETLIVPQINSGILGSLRALVGLGDARRTPNLVLERRNTSYQYYDSADQEVSEDGEFSEDELAERYLAIEPEQVSAGLNLLIRQEDGTYNVVRGPDSGKRFEDFETVVEYYDLAADSEEP